MGEGPIEKPLRPAPGKPAPETNPWEALGVADKEPPAGTVPEKTASGRPVEYLWLSKKEQGKTPAITSKTIDGMMSGGRLDSPVYNERARKDKLQSFFSLPREIQDDLNKIAKAYHPLSTGKSFYETMVNDALDGFEKGEMASPVQRAYQWYAEAKASGALDDGGSGRGYRGPVTTTSYSVTDKMSAETLLNTMAQDFLKRNLTPSEIAKYTRELNKAEAANPQVTRSDGYGPEQSQIGSTAPSKEELARRIIQSNDDFPDAAVDAKVIDMFAKSIKEGQAVIHG